jgi:hypothetical protein
MKITYSIKESKNVNTGQRSLNTKSSKSGTKSTKCCAETKTGNLTGTFCLRLLRPSGKLFDAISFSTKLTGDAGFFARN